ncbi:MAG TPA: hypothetical protein VJB35_01115 [Candidatus Nanoarchaeia archaeon]|nr:hypothetical protein [Candidatus Nanoarchaeia archaeon]
MNKNTEPLSSLKVRDLDINSIRAIEGISINPLFCIEYGSRKKESDIDLFLVDNNIPIAKSIFSNNYDLMQIEKRDFEYRFANRDIELTEPILTGKLLFGNQEFIDTAIKFLNNTSPTKGSFDYISKRSIETFLQAESYYSFGKCEIFKESFMIGEDFKILSSKIFDKKLEFDSLPLEKSLSILSYSLSYLSSLKRYQDGEGIVTFRNLLENPRNDAENLLKDVRSYFKSASKKKSQLSFQMIDYYFDVSKNLLKKELLK